MQSFEQQSNAEEDRIFEAFSRSLGVASVREYEEKQLREAKEHEAQVLELQAQQAKVRSRQQLFSGRTCLAQLASGADSCRRGRTGQKSAQQRRRKRRCSRSKGKPPGWRRRRGRQGRARDQGGRAQAAQENPQTGVRGDRSSEGQAGQIEGLAAAAVAAAAHPPASSHRGGQPAAGLRTVERDSGSSAAKKRKKRSAARTGQTRGRERDAGERLFSPNALVGTGTADSDAEDGAPPGVADGQEQPFESTLAFSTRGSGRATCDGSSRRPKLSCRSSGGGRSPWHPT